MPVENRGISLQVHRKRIQRISIKVMQRALNSLKVGQYHHPLPWVCRHLENGWAVLLVPEEKKNTKAVALRRKTGEGRNRGNQQ